MYLVTRRVLERQVVAGQHDHRVNVRVAEDFAGVAGCDAEAVLVADAARRHAPGRGDRDVLGGARGLERGEQDSLGEAFRQATGTIS